MLVPSAHFVPKHTPRKENPTENPRDLVERAFNSMHVALVRRLVLQSIASIESVVFQRAETAETHQLKRTAAAADHTVLLTIFLCLLNVDPCLKEAVMLSAATDNKHKLVSMLQHLLHTLIVDFFTDEGVSPAAFNHACEDLYIVS